MGLFLVTPTDLFALSGSSLLWSFLCVVFHSKLLQFSLSLSVRLQVFSAAVRLSPVTTLVYLRRVLLFIGYIFDFHTIHSVFFPSLVWGKRVLCCPLHRCMAGDIRRSPASQMLRLRYLKTQVPFIFRRGSLDILDGP